MRVVATHPCVQPQVLRNGMLHKQSYSRGEPTTPLSEQPAPADAYISGTKVGLVGTGADSVLFSAGAASDYLRQRSWVYPRPGPKGSNCPGSLL